MVLNKNIFHWKKWLSIFNPPRYDKKELAQIYSENNALVEKVKNNIELKPAELRSLKYLADSYLICFLNGYEEAKEQMEKARNILKRNHFAENVSLKEALRILRKVKYS